MAKLNPYQSPRAISRDRGTLGTRRRVVAFVALSLLSVPASAVAYFSTCTGVYWLYKPSSGTSEWMFYGYRIGLVLGAIVATPVFAFVAKFTARHSLKEKYVDPAFYLGLIIGAIAASAVLLAFWIQPRLIFDVMPNWLSELIL